MRVGVVNINIITTINDYRKNATIRSTIDKYDFDNIRIIETNRCWRKVEPQDRIRERTRNWRTPRHTILTYNKEKEYKTTTLEVRVLQYSLDKTLNIIVSKDSKIYLSGTRR